MKAGARIQLPVFPKWRAYGILRRQALIFAILVQGHDDLAVEFTAWVVESSCVGW